MSGERKPLRVLHVGKYYFPVEGGIENVTQEIVTGFEAGEAASVSAETVPVQTDVLVCRDRGRAEVHRLHGATIHRVASLGVLLGLPLAPGLPRAIAKLAAKYDVVHVHAPNPLPFFVNWARLKRKGVRLVIHHHSDIVRPVQRKLLRLLGSREYRFYRAADRILCTSHGQLQHSAMLQPHRDRCRVVPLSIELGSVRLLSPAERAAERARLGYEEDDVVFFFLGRLVWYKGVHCLFQAMAGTKVKLLLGGTGPMRTELTALAEKLGVADRVKFLGRVDQSERYRYYGAADAFVLPSCSAAETFGVVQLEAMAYGLPVINTALPTGVPEVSLDGETGLTVEPGNVVALREALACLGEDAPLRARFGAAAQARAQQFSREDMIASLRALYRETVQLPIYPVAATRPQPAQAMPAYRSLATQPGELR